MFPPFNFRFGGQQEDHRNRFFKNVFDQENVVNSTGDYDFASTPNVEVAQTQPGFMEVYKELMSKQNGPAMSAYRKFVEKPAPTADEFKPGKVSRLGAILSGAAAGFVNPSSGYGTAQEIISQPYREGMRRYADEGGRLREAASLEETDYKNKVGAVKAVGELQAKERDDIRQDKLANSLMSQRALSMKETQQRIEADGATFHLDKTDGIGYMVKRSGSRIPVGKFDQSTGERLADDITKMTKQSDLVGTRQVKLAGIQFGNQSRLQEDRQLHDTSMESSRQRNRLELTETRSRLAAENAAKRAKVSNPSELNNIRKNLTSVNALFDSDPDKYEDFWDGENLGNAPDKSDTEAYAAYKELYDTLYKGTAVLGVGTPSGNRIVRQ